MTRDIAALNPTAVGISCTAISQAEEAIFLCDRIKKHDPGIFIFMGGYFPTIYHEEIFSRTNTVDLIVIGEGETPTLEIIDALEKGENPLAKKIPNLVWTENGKIKRSSEVIRFDLKNKRPVQSSLLKNPKAYDILPYAFSRGCPYQCHFCMEDAFRPTRKKVPTDIIKKELQDLKKMTGADTILVSDALFKSFDLFPILRSLEMKIIFETRCDVLNPDIISRYPDVCHALAIGLESASYKTLKQMNKVKDMSHYQRYIENAEKIFSTAAKHHIPIMVFMIAGYPGDTQDDLDKSFAFANKLSQMSGPGGHIFKIGECRVYPKTKLFHLTTEMKDVEFDNDGVFGNNVVRKPSRELTFKTVLAYMEKIYALSRVTPGLQKILFKMMPFFRLPLAAVRDEIVPDVCFKDEDRTLFEINRETLASFYSVLPSIVNKYNKSMAGQRSSRSFDPAEKPWVEIKK